MLYQLSYSRTRHTRRVEKIPRTDLLSQDPAVPVPSALARFTSVFGMGTGGSTPLWARGILVFCLSKSHAAFKRQGIPAGVVIRAKRVKTSDDWDRSAQRLTALTPPAHPPGSLPGSLPASHRGRPHLGAGFPLRCFQRLSLPHMATQLMPLEGQLGNQRCVPSGPLVLGRAPLKPPAPVADRDRTVSRRSEPSSRAALMGEQPNPWDLLQPQDATSRHRGAKPPRRCGRSGEISLLSPG